MDSQNFSPPPKVSRSQEFPSFKHVLRSRNDCIVKLFVHNKHSWWNLYFLWDCFWEGIIGKQSYIYIWTVKQNLWQNCNRGTNSVQDDAFFAACQRSDLTVQGRNNHVFSGKITYMHSRKGGYWKWPQSIHIILKRLCWVTTEDALLGFTKNLLLPVPPTTSFHTLALQRACCKRNLTMFPHDVVSNMMLPNILVIPQACHEVA